MLQPDDTVPNFDVMTVGGERLDYSSIWQRKNLVLVTLTDLDSPSRDYVDALIARARGSNDDTTWLATRDRIRGVPCPGVVVADRWGEIAYVASPPRVEDLPTPDELLAWVEYLAHRCPECEGEAR